MCASRAAENRDQAARSAAVGRGGPIASRWGRARRLGAPKGSEVGWGAQCPHTLQQSGGGGLVVGEGAAGLAVGAGLELAHALLADAHLTAERLEGARLFGQQTLLDDAALPLRER